MEEEKQHSPRYYRHGSKKNREIQELQKARLEKSSKGKEKQDVHSEEEDWTEETCWKDIPPFWHSSEDE